MKLFPIVLGFMLVTVAYGEHQITSGQSLVPASLPVIISTGGSSSFGSAHSDNLANSNNNNDNNNKLNNNNDKPYEKLIKGRKYRVYSDRQTQEECVRAINQRRRLHQNTSDLIIGWDSTGYTEERADNIIDDIETNQKVKRGRYPYGESFFWYYDQNQYRSIEDAIRTWYSEGKLYDYNQPGFSQSTGGFTQLVWKSSREVTCVKVEYETKNHFKTLLVANFWPAGNVEKKFPFNVLPPIRHPDDEDRPRPRPTSRPDYEKPRPRPTSRPDYERPRPRPTQIPDYERPPYRPTGSPDYDPPPYRPTRRPDYPDYDYPSHPISRFIGDVKYLEPVQTIVVVPQV